MRTVKILHTDCDWLLLHIETLFRLDARGQLLTLRQEQSSPAPRFYLGRTRHGNLWRFGRGEGLDTRRRLSRLAGREAPLSAPPDAYEPLPPAERQPSLLEALGTSGADANVWRGPAFRFPRAEAGRARLHALARGALPLDPADAELMAKLERGFPDLRPLFADVRLLEHAHVVVAGDRVVSHCFTARGEPAIASEAGVATILSERGRGHAVSCVAGWALSLMRAGAVPLYSTRWSNRESRAVARKLGLELYAEDFHVT
jgi:hypothetical protein